VFYDLPSVYHLIPIAHCHFKKERLKARHPQENQYNYIFINYRKPVAQLHSFLELLSAYTLLQSKTLCILFIFLLYLNSINPFRHFSSLLTWRDHRTLPTASDRTQHLETNFIRNPKQPSNCDFRSPPLVQAAIPAYFVQESSASTISTFSIQSISFVHRR
jgi:hypothetical protein